MWFARNRSLKCKSGGEVAVVSPQASNSGGGLGEALGDREEGAIFREKLKLGFQTRVRGLERFFLPRLDVWLKVLRTAWR